VCSVRSLLLSACALTTIASAQRGDDLLLRVGTFVRAASDQLNGVIADETYRQELYAQPFESGIRPRIRQRSMRSEALFLRLPAVDQWMFVRNVVAVDATPVPDSGERLDRLFEDSTIDAAAYLRQLQRENARFDIGPVVRTLGDPTFALRYLAPQAQAWFAFSRNGTARLGDTRATRLRFSERRRPYIVTVNGMDGQSTGTMWIDEADGSVSRTELRIALPSGRGVAATITVDFQRDPHLRIWVPRKMSEQYYAMNGQMTSSTASYANFHRFDAAVRVLAPEAQHPEVQH
jgi:hypothetical protein